MSKAPDHGTPMHAHRPRRNPTTVKSRLASSENARTRNGKIKVSLSTAPWGNKTEKAK